MEEEDGERWRGEEEKGLLNTVETIATILNLRASAEAAAAAPIATAVASRFTTTKSWLCHPGI